MAKATGATAYAPWYLANQASAQASLGYVDEARHSLRDALTAADATQERWSEADIHQAAGEIALRSSGPEALAAEAHFKSALATAQTQQARSLELRAAMALARLWSAQRKHEQARELLAPIYAGFNEGFDTCDLKEAKVLLDGLASGI